MSNIIRSKMYVMSLDSKKLREHISFKLRREEILDYFMRMYPLTKYDTKLITRSDQELADIAEKIGLPYNQVFAYIGRFLAQITHFRKLLHGCKIRRGSGNMERKTRIYLHKIHRFAPVFDYKRAKANLRVLYRLLSIQRHFPSISTQLALVIYITDELDKDKKVKLLQKNIRSICSSSAYAFHKAKNRLNIDKLIGKNK